MLPIYCGNTFHSVPDAIDMNEAYRHLMEMIRSVLDGTLELNTFEEQLRDIFTGHAYIAFTVDKLIQNIGRQVSIFQASLVACLWFTETTLVWSF